MKGLIKLYEIIYNEDIEKIKLEYIQDIQIDKIKKVHSKLFKNSGPICCIEQSKEDGNILISCFDSNIYLFSKPILDNIEEMKNNNIFTLLKGRNKTK